MALFSFRTRHKSCIASAVRPMRTECARLMYLGTKEARLSMVVTPLGRSSDRPKHLPTRQPSGGTPVVVGDVNDVAHGEGVQDDLCWTTEGFANSGGFPRNIEEAQRRL